MLDLQASTIIMQSPYSTRAKGVRRLDTSWHSPHHQHSWHWQPGETSSWRVQQDSLPWWQICGRVTCFEDLLDSSWLLHWKSGPERLHCLQTRPNQSRNYRSQLPLYLVQEKSWWEHHCLRFFVWQCISIHVLHYPSCKCSSFHFNHQLIPSC